MVSVGIVCVSQGVSQGVSQAVGQGVSQAVGQGVSQNVEKHAGVGEDGNL
tara:strand:+ start:66 stop:215 length:150 start_codon:yes stop_codon:yes gene_type:complete